jgi:ubiquinone/menaquinone biosynthesis C-methylase UbiE
MTETSMKAAIARADLEARLSLEDSPTLRASAPLPAYLEQTYGWAYLHPLGVRIFERQWLVNLILWGNYARLRDAACAELSPLEGNLLQIACVYGDFTQHFADRLGHDAQLEVADVAPVQLQNLRRKLRPGSRVVLRHADSARLRYADASFDGVVVFFLLHEQPESVRARTVTEAMRVVRPGGKVVFVDYHRPARLNPLRYLMPALLHLLEPFALGLWRTEIASWLPALARGCSIEKRTYFGGLYQKVVVTRPAIVP